MKDNYYKKSLSRIIGMTMASPLILSQSLPSFAEELMIEEVIVTTQMRKESLQDVPASVSAYDAEFFKTRNVSDFKQLFEFTPGISGITNDSFFDAVSVRGINNNGFDKIFEPFRQAKQTLCRYGRGLPLGW